MQYVHIPFPIIRIHAQLWVVIYVFSPSFIEHWLSSWVDKRSLAFEKFGGLWVSSWFGNKECEYVLNNLRSSLLHAMFSPFREMLNKWIKFFSLCIPKGDIFYYSHTMFFVILRNLEAEEEMQAKYPLLFDSLD